MRGLQGITGLIGNGARCQPWRGIIDKVQGAVAAYSMRRLSARYNGPCLRVRRSSDNAEMDIGFVQQSLDVATVVWFVDEGDGYVIKIYDQSGHGNHMLQDTAINQPVIASAGAVKNGLEFSQTKALQTSGSISLTSWFTATVIITGEEKGGTQRIFSQDDGSADSSLRLDNSQFHTYKVPNQAVGGSVDPSTAYALHGGVESGVRVFDNVNGVLIQNTIHETIYSGTPAPIRMSSLWGPESFLGRIQEMLVFDAIPADAAISLMADNQMRYFGVS